MSAFKAMELMSKNNQDIAATNSFVRGQSTKRGDEITMGLESGYLQKIASGKYITCLFVINAAEFEAAKKELEAEA